MNESTQISISTKYMTKRQYMCSTADLWEITWWSIKACHCRRHRVVCQLQHAWHYVR